MLVGLEKGKVQSFTGLVAWQEGHKLVLQVYTITDAFPAKEQFILTSQICRAAISVTSNIAEGFGRSTAKDKEHFFTMANGSLYEVKNQLISARDRGYISKEQFDAVAEQANVAHKLLHGLLRSHKT
jgi:four helix bundle protein